VTLIGGGWDPQVAATIYGRFVAASAAKSGEALIAVVLLDEGDGVAALGERFGRALASAGPARSFTVAVPLGGRLTVDDLGDATGLLVGGGLTPGYADAVVPFRHELRAWMADRDAPYAGFSAGAAIAGTKAVVGGWRYRGQPVCPEDAGEDLDEVTVVAGLGLVPFTIEVHADTWATTPRLAAALAELGPGHGGYSIDENAAVVSEDDTVEIVGAGRAVWLSE
jgi:cyanophycinase